MKIKTSELTGAALDWAVAKCEGFKPHAAASLAIMGDYSPSTNWAQGGPIIEREGIDLYFNVYGTPKQWKANYQKTQAMNDMCFAPTPLEAAMRSYVSNKLGNEVEIPKELS